MTDERKQAILDAEQPFRDWIAASRALDVAWEAQQEAIDRINPRLHDQWIGNFIGRAVFAFCAMERGETVSDEDAGATEILDEGETQ